jgi:predicted CXXCH cytochrome family protein
MHEMTRLPGDAVIRAPFAGETFRFKDDAAVLEQKDGVRFMRLSSQHFGDHIYRVTKLIGGRYREDYAGVEVAAVDPRAVPINSPVTGQPASNGFGDELLLPVSYLLQTQSYRLKGYSVMVGDRPGLRAGGVWNQTCVFCHNTYPYFDSTWGALHGRGAPTFQGEVVDRLLPSERRWTFKVTDEQGLAQAVSAEASFVAGQGQGRKDAAPVPDADDRQAVLAAGIQTLRRSLTAEHLLEIGIGCESCHGGSREHVQKPSVLPDFAPHSAFMNVRGVASAERASRAELINRTCARCHQVLFSRYPFTWEGGRRTSGPGGSHITSGEARDFLLGGCARQMACTTCHDPHAADQPERMARLQTPAGNVVCTACHSQYQTGAALRGHAHHDPGGAGGSCVACHMPRKNMGLGTALTRYHRIGSPTDQVRVEKDRPLECALCHADKTVLQLVGDMERWWGRRYSRTALAQLYGDDLNRNVLVATVERGKAHEQSAAIVAVGEHQVTQGTMAVARQVLNPYPLVRTYALRALRSLTGRDCPVDLNGSDAEIAGALGRCVPGTSWTAPPVNDGTAKRAPRPWSPHEPDED